jgi:hypothetical protein
MHKIYITRYTYNLHCNDFRYLQSFAYCHFVNNGDVGVANKMWEKVNEAAKKSEKDALKVIMNCYIGIK